MKKIIFFVVVLALGITLGIYLQKQSKTQKIETQVQTDADKAGDAVKEGAQKVETVATNVAAHVKTGVQQAGEVVTNAIGEVKDKLN